MDIKVDNTTVICFDLDDTLYNEIDYLKSAYTYISKKLDSEHFESLNLDMLSMYKDGKDVFQYLVENYAIDKEKLLHMYRYHTPNISLFEGVYDIFQAILKQGGHLAIITDGRVKTQMAKLEALGIKELFSTIVISEALGSEKPNELNYKSVEQANRASRFVYIADNIKKDFLTPNALGWQTIGIRDNGFNIHTCQPSDVTKNYLPQEFINSYAEINIIS